MSHVQDATDPSLPIFRVERVQLQFSIASDFVAAQVANNVLVLALSTGRILRIDLDNPAEIDGSSLIQPLTIHPVAPNLPSAQTLIFPRNPPTWVESAASSSTPPPRI